MYLFASLSRFLQRSLQYLYRRANWSGQRIVSQGDHGTSLIRSTALGPTDYAVGSSPFFKILINEFSSVVGIFFSVPVQRLNVFVVLYVLCVEDMDRHFIYRDI